jgi:hypothetical protein
LSCGFLLLLLLLLVIQIEAGGVHSAAMQATRHARRIYVGGIGTVDEKVLRRRFVWEHLSQSPSPCSALRARCFVQEITEFFNDVVTKALGKPPPSGGSYVINVYINHERRFAFVEFGSIPLTTACMQLGESAVLCVVVCGAVSRCSVCAP